MCGLLLAQRQATPPGAPCPQTTLVRFDRGPHWQDLSQVEQRHIAYIQEQMKSGNIVSAGPVAGSQPDTVMKLSGADWSRAETILKADPYVLEGVLKIASHQVSDECESGTTGAPVHTSCTLASRDCTEINLDKTDHYSTVGRFAGYADPTIRQDPQTGTLWMAYSWPHTMRSPGREGPSQVVDTHVSYSTDKGKTWTYKGALFKADPVVNKATGASEHASHEVMNLLPQVVKGVTYWYGIHSVYNVAPGRGVGRRANRYTKRWQIAMAPGNATTGPMGLASAASQYLGQRMNTEGQSFPVALDLSAIDPEVSGCMEFYEPALAIANDNLYLFLSCQPAASPATFYAVFKTSSPQEHAPNWKWKYVAQGSTKFANLSDARSVSRYLGSSATYLTQMDIAPGKKPGTLLAIMTAAYNEGGHKVSLGCVAAEMAGLDPPKFVYDSQGRVQVNAYITSPDSEPTGAGSCTYSPFSATGMIMAHRQGFRAPQNGGFFTFLMQSLLFP